MRTRPADRIRSATVVVVFLTAFRAPHALANNGLNLIGFGSESVMMAGADVAVSRDSGALSTNPAGMTQIHGQSWDLRGVALHIVETRHKDNFGNDSEVSRKWVFGGDLGYASMDSKSRLAWGIGFFGQGGSGSVYDNLRTAFGTRDRLSSLTRVAKLTPGVAFQVTPALSIGATLGIFYADAEQAFFPNTSSLSSSTFFGSDFKGASTIAPGVKLGAQYRLSDRLNLGITYGSEVNLKLKGGHMALNMTAVGLGVVNYADAQLAGLHLPQEIAAGLAWQATDNWLISTKLLWLDWSSALKTQTLTATQPDNPAAPAVIRSTTALNWRDQYVFALGTQYQLSQRMAIMGGYNYGRNPQPRETMSPLLLGYGQHHFTLGYRYQRDDKWKIYSGLEYVLRERETYTNAQLPFGQNAQTSGELFYVHIGAGRVW